MEEVKLDPAVCYLKPEFTKGLLDKSKNEEERNGEGEPPTKKQRKEKNKGQNKNRPVFREAFDDKLCRALVDGAEGKCEREVCKFLHDVKAYLDKKPPDLGEKCPIYSTKGFCTYGIACRFGTEHITEDFKNMSTDKRVKEDRSLLYDVQISLRKKTYDFSSTDKIVKETEELKEQLKKLGSCGDDENVAVRPEEKKSVDFRNKLVLSPLTTVGNLPFRRICKEFGADITVGEMACSHPLVTACSLSEWALTKRHPSEDVFGIQIEGNNAKTIAYAAQVLSEQVEVDFIDLNIGCPIDLIFKHGGGSALIRRQNVLETVVRSCSKLLKEKPFTVKTRTGINANNLAAKDLLPKLENWGASAVTLHGRTKEQRYSRMADWNYIEECAAGVKEIPVIGNGDIYSFQDYQHIKENYTHVSSVMIGRGALIKPWIFKEIKEEKTYDISSQERLELVKKYVHYGLEHWGSDTRGVETTRRFLLEWLSFLYRYVPHGIVLYPPQKINQRPETDFYLGRDDLETLMRSDNSKDWITISEMFLGKVPEGFVFLPKHKANAY